EPPAVLRHGGPAFAVDGAAVQQALFAAPGRWLSLDRPPALWVAQHTSQGSAQFQDLHPDAVPAERLPGTEPDATAGMCPGARVLEQFSSTEARRPSGDRCRRVVRLWVPAHRQTS